MTPDLREMLDTLASQYRPRCFNPDRETVEEHLRYAGKVELVQLIRSQHGLQEK